MFNYCETVNFHRQYQGITFLNLKFANDEMSSGSHNPAPFTQIKRRCLQNAPIIDRLIHKYYKQARIKWMRTSGNRACQVCHVEC